MPPAEPAPPAPAHTQFTTGETEYRYLSFAIDDEELLTAHLPPGEVTEQGLPPPPALAKYGDPQKWSTYRKSFVTWLSCLSTFVTTYTPGAYAAGAPQYVAVWGVGTMSVYAGITVFTLCFAIAPMFLAPLSELTGRRPLFLAAGVVFVVSQLGSAVTASFAGLLVTRALAGLSCSVFSTVVGGVISDIYVAEDRNTAMAIFTGAALSGTGVGPMVSGIITAHLSWRWIFYLQTITCGLVVVALFLFFPETRGSVLLSRKARVLNMWYEEVERACYDQLAAGNVASDDAVAEKDTIDQGDGQEQSQTTAGAVRWKVKSDEEHGTLASIIKTSLVQAMHLLVTESVVFWFSLWMSFAWSILYLTFEAVPLIFSGAYGFSPQASGLCFLAVVVASVIAAVAAVWQERLVTDTKSGFHGFVRRRGTPEARLVFACGQTLLLPVGLFWLGATARPTIPWIVPVLGVGCLTLGISSVYLAVFNYLADTYHTYASSAIAAQAFTRNVFAACLPLAVEPMLDSLGFTGTGCLLGGIGLALSAVPWVLMLWGPQIRKRSPVASLAHV